MLTILKNIGGVLRNAEDYMLDPAGFILEEDYIFVNPNNFETLMLYAPTTKHYGKTFKVFVKSCVINNAFDLSEDATFPTVINNHINQFPNESNNELTKFLETMLYGAQGAPAAGGNVQPAAAPVAPVTPGPAAQNPIPATARQTPANNMGQRPVGGMMPPPPPPARTNGGMAVPPIAPQPPQKPEKKGGLFGGKKDKAPKQPQQPAGFGGMAVPGQGGGFGGMAIPGQPAPKPQMNMPPQPPQAPPMQPPVKPFGKPAVQNVPPAVQNVPPAVRNVPPSVPPMQNNTLPIAPAGGFAPVADPMVDDGVTVLIHHGGQGGQSGQGAAMPSMTAVLVDKNGRSYPIQKPAFFIGKGTNTSIVNDLVVPNQNVSRSHAVIENNGGVYFLTDSNSLNGTFVNGERLAANMKRQLKSGDMLRFANEEYTFRLN